MSKKGFKLFLKSLGNNKALHSFRYIEKTNNYTTFDSFQTNGEVPALKSLKTTFQIFYTSNLLNKFPWISRSSCISCHRKKVFLRRKNLKLIIPPYYRPFSSIWLNRGSSFGKLRPIHLFGLLPKCPEADQDLLSLHLCQPESHYSSLNSIS